MGRKSKLQESGYHPTGAEFDKDAPYNQHDRKQTVVVSITISKAFNIESPDDSTEEDLLLSIPEVIKMYNFIKEEGWNIDEETAISDVDEL